MKSTILSMVFFLVFGKVICQKPMPTYTDNPQWNMVYTGYLFSDCYAVNIFLKPDTFICGRTYSPIAWCGPAKCGVSGYFRQSGNKVYIRYPWSANCNEEYLVYDFDLNIGDTALCMSDLGDSTRFWVVNKANVMYEGVSRLTLTMSCYYMAGFGGMKWIYGVGSNFHPFHSLACIGPECEHGQKLVKATLNGAITYKDTVLAFSCPGWVGLKENSLTSEIKIYPTLTREEINFEFDSDAGFEIRNILGQQILSGKTQAGLNKLSISALSAGLYFFVLKNRGSLYTARFIKE